jgi:hypothetical protein
VRLVPPHVEPNPDALTCDSARRSTELWLAAIRLASGLSVGVAIVILFQSGAAAFDTAAVFPEPYRPASAENSAEQPFRASLMPLPATPNSESATAPPAQGRVIGVSALTDPFEPTPSGDVGPLGYDGRGPAPVAVARNALNALKAAKPVLQIKGTKVVAREPQKETRGVSDQETAKALESLQQAQLETQSFLGKK